MDPRDIELRDIEIFLTLSDELHFGRTAERLYISQARVSQVIRKIETQVGGKLFERSSRNVALTPIGRRLAEDLHITYRDLRASLGRAARAARHGEDGLLRIGVTSSSLAEIRPLLKIFEAQRPNCSIHIEHVHFGNPFGALRADEIDVLVSWLPIEEPDPTVGPTIHYARPDVTYIPMPDAPPARWALIWRRGGETDLIRDLAAIAAAG
ncbi:LysR family transcriptional regulator [Nocardia tengchongensis]|uniref:LysR family transcriptional regulator n=1 Tax=Nocardia tengchongensis TaxID=2055889 RepID=UPI003655F5A1